MAEPRRILFVFAWLVVGGEETEVRLLARHLDPARYRIDVLPCFRKAGMPDQTHRSSKRSASGRPPPPTSSRSRTRSPISPAHSPATTSSSPARTCRHLPALERLAHPPAAHRAWRPRLRGARRAEALHRPLCRRLPPRSATPPPRRMPGAEQHAVEIPSMVDLGEFDPGAPRARSARALGHRARRSRSSAGSAASTARSGSRISSAPPALVHAAEPDARFLVIGGPDAFMPDYADELRALAAPLGLDGALRFLGDRADVPACSPRSTSSSGCPAAKACRTSSPRPAPRASGRRHARQRRLQQIEDGVSGLFVPHEDPPPSPPPCASFSPTNPCAAAWARTSRPRSSASTLPLPSPAAGKLSSTT